ncbi:hypothetical protein, partial [Methanosarcina sp. UBA411]|uniref:hypothetical protein n=1 Tax=Methanosarcina sp. UBA411 TaxID=1915589 RepID=UPI0025D268C1
MEFATDNQTISDRFRVRNEEYIIKNPPQCEKVLSHGIGVGLNGSARKKEQKVKKKSNCVRP